LPNRLERMSEYPIYGEIKVCQTCSSARIVKLATRKTIKRITEANMPNKSQHTGHITIHSVKKLAITKETTKTQTYNKPFLFVMFYSTIFRKKAESCEQLEQSSHIFHLQTPSCFKVTSSTLAAAPSHL